MIARFFRLVIARHDVPKQSQPHRVLIKEVMLN